MKIKNKEKRISIFILVSFMLQMFQGFSIGKIVQAETIKSVEITKENVIKEVESNTISFKVKIKNINEEELNLNDLALSYWYDNQGIEKEEIVKDWCSVDQSKVDVQIEKLDKNYEKANSKINIKFNEGLNKLKKDEEVELNIRLQNKDNKNYNQEKNYSYANDVTVDYKGQLIHGVLPTEIKEESIIKVDAKMYNKYLDKDITSIYPWFKILNSGNTDLDLSKLEVRYYYTGDSDGNETNEEIVIDWANIGKEKITSEIVKVEELEDADRYLSLKMNVSEKLTAGNELEIHSRVNKKDWPVYNQENDYSFNKDAKDYVNWDKILVLYDGNILSGVEPEINEGLEIINLKAERRKNIVSLEWDKNESLKYTIMKGNESNNLTEYQKDIATNMYLDEEADELSKKYYYQIISFDANGNKVGKSKKVHVSEFKDTDNDALSDEEELELGTDPSNEDSDGDGLLDGEEVLMHETNPLEVDTDKDGLDDYFEVYISDTNPLKPDSDDNGVLDGDEDKDKDGLTVKQEQKLETNPLEADTDFDGLNDKEEVEKYKTNPNKKDTDDDGILDGKEIELKLNPNKKDTDNNGTLDGDELLKYTHKPSANILDENISIEINGNFIGKDIANIAIVNMKNTHVMTSKETPGYLGNPYLVKIPKASKDISFKFDYSKLKLDDKKNPTLYKLDKELNTLVEVKGQDKSTKGIITVNFENGIESKEDNKYSVNDQFLIIDKDEWDKYWENEIKHPSEKGKLDLAFVIDTSGSMSSNDRNKYRVKLAEHFINKKENEDKMALVGFSSSSSVYQALTADKKALLDNVHRLGADSGGTNISAGVDSAIQQLKNSKDRNKKIILLTDGEGTFHDSSLEQAKNENIKIYTIGLGSNYNKTLLEKIANETGGKYYHVKTGEEIGDITDDIHGEAGSGDMDGDGVPDKDDKDPYEFNINSDDFVKQDRIFMQAAKLSYEKTDEKIGKEVRELNLGKDFELLKNWEIIDSNDSTMIEGLSDSGFGAIALQNGEDIIIAFEGSGGLLSPEALYDWIKTDGGVIGLGLNSKQVYEAYRFMYRILALKSDDANVYIAGHSLGGWIAQKIGGSLLNPSINLTEKTAHGDKYYNDNQIPKTAKKAIEKYLLGTFNENKDDIKKIVTFAGPGFWSETRIYDNQAQMSKKVYNYKMNTDAINQFGANKYLLGRNKWMKSGVWFPVSHFIAQYYDKFDKFFTASTYEQND